MLQSVSTGDRYFHSNAATFALVRRGASSQTGASCKEGGRSLAGCFSPALKK